ncbi:MULTISPECIES: alpha/beta fold hydrolase [unclassified Rhodococcus (in: high G+C Gram-positive bacteria)]|uniref:alpha/beta fold hydrolase n=1 Tax=unclassified Rhodococcus (in: high G+C Gram-positive bacteria) TaxID=192944 RepID=UPI00163A932A|nr:MULTISPECIES: alpha/beta hydrolase [unclassified Rhodococcus (in: high G+C Gram-positive bacteria)]MBC2637696.1 alpha/beta hydrolase [Rhodococcus sp. 3A]MBC2897560.1 alpha/beta hydrolase [Rhodococcus sp. 4CII]
MSRKVAVGGHHTRVVENVLPSAEVRRLPRAGESLVDAPLIVLLHGFGDNADTWRAVLVELGRRGRRAVAPDLPGFGEASPLNRGDILPQYDAFLTDLIAELGGSGPVVVVGNSMGGTVALRAASGRPDVVAVAALAPAGLGFHRVLHVADRTLGSLVPILRVAYRIPYPQLVVQLAVAAYYRVRIAPGVVNAWRFGAGVHGMKDIRRMGALGLVLMREIEEGAFDFADMAGEVVLMWGTDDEVCDVAAAQPLLDHVPGARLVMLEGAGHVPQVQQPAVVADVVAALGRAGMGRERHV